VVKKKALELSRALRKGGEAWESLVKKNPANSWVKILRRPSTTEVAGGLPKCAVKPPDSSVGIFPS